MRYISVILVLAFFATMLEASYYRSVRVVSYPKESSAKKAAQKLENFIATKKNLLEFQENLKYEVRVVKAGKYFMVVMEPFALDKVKELQEIVDVLRDKYPHAYVKKIKSKNAPKKVTSKKSKPAKEVKKEPVKKKNIETKKVTPPKQEPKLDKATPIMVAEPLVEVVEVQKMQIKNPKPVKEQPRSEVLQDKKDLSAAVNTEATTQKVVQLSKESESNETKEELNETKESEVNVTQELNEAVEKLIAKPTIAKKEEKKEPEINTTDVEEIIENSQEEETLFDLLTPIYENIVILWQALFAITLLAFLVMYKRFLNAKNRSDELIEQEVVDSQKIDKLTIELSNKQRYIEHIGNEIVSPLESVIELSRELEESELSSECETYIQKLEGSAQNVALVFHDVVALKALDEKRLKLEEQEFNINDILKSIIYSTALDAKKSNIAVSIDVNKDVPAYLVGDKKYIEHVLRNIFSNAIKRLKASHIFLELEHSIDDDDIITLSFKLRDSGKGMSEAEIKNAFELYSNAGDDEEDRVDLGLHVAKRLIELMGGEISIESKEGTGTTVLFTMKVNVRDPQERRHYRVPSEEFLGKSVLLIESSNRNIAALKHAFEYFNYTVIALSSFEEAAHLEEVEVDILVVNQHKLIEGALEAVEKIQKTALSPLIILSDIYTPVDEELLENFRVDAILTTPLIQQDVFDVVKVILSKESKYGVHLKEETKLDEIKLEEESFQVTEVVADEPEESSKSLQNSEQVLEQSSSEEIFEASTQKREVHKELNVESGLEEVVENTTLEESKEEDVTIENKHDESAVLELVEQESDSTDTNDSSAENEIQESLVVDSVELSQESSLLEIDSNEAEKAEDQAKENIEALLTDVGIANCENDEDFYNSMLEEFRRTYENSSNTIEALCEAGDFEKARYYAMDIKDLAINIGAYELSESVAAMEYEFEKAQESDWIKHISLYALSLDRLLTEISNRLDK